MTLIAGTIITFDEEGQIAARIASLRRVCAEVVAAGSPGTDRSTELGLAAGARVVPHSCPGESPHGNPGGKHAGHDGIHAPDDGERLDDELAAAIQAFPLKGPAEVRAFNRKSQAVPPVGPAGIGSCPDFVTRLYFRTPAPRAPKPGHPRGAGPARAAPAARVGYTGAA